MDNLQELSNKIDILTKQVTKLLNINTKVAKVLHLLPVTEKEERDLQLLQRKNIQIAAKVNDELNAMENKPSEDVEVGEMFHVTGNIFSDVLADDFVN